MTAKHKSEQLVNDFMKPIDGLHKYPMCYDTAKQCALIAVDEILKQADNWGVNSVVGYWQQVKNEINAMK